MESKILEKLLPLWDITSAVEQLIDENKKLEEENKKLKERIKWFEDSLEKNAKASGEAIHNFITACLDGRITVNDKDETVIKSTSEE